MFQSKKTVFVVFFVNSIKSKVSLRDVEHLEKIDSVQEITDVLTHGLSFWILKRKKRVNLEIKTCFYVQYQRNHTSFLSKVVNFCPVVLNGIMINLVIEIHMYYESLRHMLLFSKSKPIPRYGANGGKSV